MSTNRTARQKRGQKKDYPIYFSQSFMNDAVNKDVCPRYLRYKYIDQIEEDDEDTKLSFLKGKYFEWHLLGATRDGQEPRFEQNKTARNLPGGGKDYRPQAQVDLDALVVYAKGLLKELGLDPAVGEKQTRLKSDDLIGHLDWITKDMLQEERQALYDVKYTDTAYDDRYRGWADFETKIESKVQAVHYTVLNYLARGVMLPFYFLIFGKGYWCRVIKVELTRDGVEWHERLLNRVRELSEKWLAEDWQPTPEFNKCLTCPYHNLCPDKAIKPQIETFVI